MSNFWQKFSLKKTVLQNGLGYTQDFIEAIYTRYLGHKKIIHYREGLPVYSLSTPAIFSKPMANFSTNLIFRVIQNRNLPSLVSYAVNDVCNAGCEHCSFFSAVEEKGRQVLNLDEAKKFISDIQDLGVSVINFVGGEPLLRQDLPQIIASVDKTKSTTVMFTNGLLLEERAASLKKAGLDSIYISIDCADAQEHDKFRRTPGLFIKAFKGIAAAKKLGFSVGISTTMTPESYKSGELLKIIELAKKEGVHEVLVFEAFPTGRYKNRKDLVNNHQWVDQMIESARELNKDPSYPGITFFSYFTSYKSTGCSCGTSYMYLSPYGDVMSCDFNHRKFGNILEKPLWQVWEKLTTDIEFCSSKWGGCKIKDEDLRNSGIVDDGRKEAIEKFKKRIGEPSQYDSETKKSCGPDCDCKK
jgi:MoaA/NifB/PqqE/SkfB family radical SAM enzyme